MWLCEGKLKMKIAHFRLPSASQKRACLNVLVSEQYASFCARYFIGQIPCVLAACGKRTLTTLNCSIHPMNMAIKFSYSFDQLAKSLHVVQFVSHSAVFGFTLVTDRIAHHSVLLPLLILLTICR